MKVLVLVDIQNDFLPGAALAIPKGDEIIPVVNKLQQYFDLVVATQDWHPSNHKSFASNHPGKKPFDTIDLNGLSQTLWPDHCVQGTTGAGFPSGLNMNRVEAIFRKGTVPEIDSYSAFYDNGHRKSIGLAGYLRQKEVQHVYLTGLAGDICVYATAMDALGEGFQTYIVEDATRPLDEKAFITKNATFTNKEGRLVTSAELTNNKSK